MRGLISIKKCQHYPSALLDGHRQLQSVRNVVMATISWCQNVGHLELIYSGFANFRGCGDNYF